MFIFLVQTPGDSKFSDPRDTVLSDITFLGKCFNIIIEILHLKYDISFLIC